VSVVVSALKRPRCSGGCDAGVVSFQVRNLCYMVTRREKMKHTMCDLQEKIFHLQIQLLEEDVAGGNNTHTHIHTHTHLCVWK